MTTKMISILTAFLFVAVAASMVSAAPFGYYHHSSYSSSFSIYGLIRDDPYHLRRFAGECTRILRQTAASKRNENAAGWWWHEPTSIQQDRCQDLQKDLTGCNCTDTAVGEGTGDYNCVKADVVRTAVPPPFAGPYMSSSVDRTETEDVIRDGSFVAALNYNGIGALDFQLDCCSFNQTCNRSNDHDHDSDDKEETEQEKFRACKVLESNCLHKSFNFNGTDNDSPCVQFLQKNCYDNCGGERFNNYGRRYKRCIQTIGAVYIRAGGYDGIVNQTSSTTSDITLIRP